MPHGSDESDLGFGVGVFVGHNQDHALGSNVLGIRVQVGALTSSSRTCCSRSFEGRDRTLIGIAMTSSAKVEGSLVQALNAPLSIV